MANKVLETSPVVTIKSQTNLTLSKGKQQQQREAPHQNNKKGKNKKRVGKCGFTCGLMLDNQNVSSTACCE
jgi:hypothetical protein